MHSSALFLCTLFALFDAAPFLVLPHVALASCRTFLCCTHFVFDFIRVAAFHMALFSKCTFFVLYPVHVADFCVLHSSHVATFLVLLHVALTSCCFFFYVALISSCTFSVLHFFHNAPFSSFCFLVLYTFCVALFHVPHFSFCTIFE